MQTVGANPTPGDKTRIWRAEAVRDRGDPTLLLSQPAQAPSRPRALPRGLGARSWRPSPDSRWGRSPRCSCCGASPTSASSSRSTHCRSWRAFRSAAGDGTAPRCTTRPARSSTRSARYASSSSSRIATAAPSSSRAPRAERARRCRRSISRASSSRSAAGCVLVDLDLRRPELAAQLGVVPGRDLLDVTRRSDPLADALHQVQGEPLLRLAGPTSMLDPRKVEQFEARLPSSCEEARAGRRLRAASTAPARRGQRRPCTRTAGRPHARRRPRRPDLARRAGDGSRPVAQGGRAATGYVLVGGVSRRRGRAQVPADAGGKRAGRVCCRVQRPPAPRGDEKELGWARSDGPRSGRAWRGADELNLAPTGRRVLERLMRRPGEVVSRAELFADSPARTASGGQSTSTAASRSCASGWTGPSPCASIETVRGQGYRLRADGGQAPARAPSTPAR